ncbi:MAG TPA: glycosyltransferase [Ferrovibrio sp.]|uniref:CgeB family protein n=1 Tax=Ferrovibrio sp. TaxID=1917215 RepID=UPI002ED0FBA2
MRIILYTQSLISDWNHGNAHFLRGVLRELATRGHSVLALEPTDSWSRSNLVADQGPEPIERFSRDFPELPVRTYDDQTDHATLLADADVVIVHEWTAPEIVARIGRLRWQAAPFTLLFHDTHHRAVSDRDGITALLLQDFDGILVFGESLRARYHAIGWDRNVFVWHEAVDQRLFRPVPDAPQPRKDLIWIGNWGDGERTKELSDFLIEPARRLRLSGTIRGVRYPAEARQEIEAAGLTYGGWIANADVPAAFARHRLTLHVPRQPYAMALPGIPTIRVFEALACGIPLICAPWEDSEGLFRPGEDYLIARNGEEMQRHIAAVLSDPDLARALAASGLETIRRRHTCSHRVDQLLNILQRLGRSVPGRPSRAVETVP